MESYCSGLGVHVYQARRLGWGRGGGGGGGGGEGRSNLPSRPS